MESAALYCNAARAGKKALCICTVSDSFVKEGVNMTAQARETAFTNMIEIALEIA
jgi:purine-nucleoside phosphorylase